MVSSLFVSFTTHQIEIASFPRALAAGMQVNGPSSQLHRHGLPTVPPACWPVVVLPQPHPHFPAGLSQPKSYSADLMSRFGLFRFIFSHTILFILPIKSYLFYQSIEQPPASTRWPHTLQTARANRHLTDTTQGGMWDHAVRDPRVIERLRRPPANSRPARSRLLQHAAGVGTTRKGILPQPNDAFTLLAS